MTNKGANAERELIHLFWANSWTACRVAGSGRMNYPSPDIIANKNGASLAIECKATKSDSQYLEKREVEELKAFAQKAGARALIALRFNHKPWLFLNPEDLADSGQNYVASLQKAELKGLKFEELAKGL